MQRRHCPPQASATAIPSSLEIDYAVGQVWTYRARSYDGGWTMQINRIESLPRLGEVFHVSVFGLRVRNPGSPTGYTTELPHLPLSKEALDRSVIALERRPPVAIDDAEGYATWRQAFDAGQAGAFTISLAEIVESIESSLEGAGA